MEQPTQSRARHEDTVKEERKSIMLAKLSVPLAQRMAKTVWN